MLPYVYTCPSPECILRPNDKFYVFANPILLHKAVEEFNEMQPEVDLADRNDDKIHSTGFFSSIMEDDDH